jgi:transcriptional antiterminator RfaH
MWGSDSCDWLIARTHRHREALAADHAARQGCQCFLPLVFDSHTQRESVFFPGYLFIRPPSASIRFLDSTRGVSQIMRFGECLATIRDSELRELFDRTEVVGDTRAIILPPFKPGQVLRVRCGSFADANVEFKRYRPGNRVEILVQFLGRKATTTVPCHWVEAA